jgi:type II secretory pathway pseudopilin PulG
MRTNDRRAYTLLEILVVLCLTLLVLGALYQFWITSTRYSADLEARFTVLSRGQVSLTALTRQINQARRILYPTPGGKDQSGLSLVSGSGKVLVIAFEPGKGGTPGTIQQRDLLTGQKSQLMDGILNLQCRVPPVPLGRDPDLVHLTVTMAGPAGRPLYVMMSARLRPLDIRCPINR